MAKSARRENVVPLEEPFGRGVLAAIFGGEGITMALFREDNLAYLY